MPCYHAADGVYDAPCTECYIEGEMESEDLSFATAVNAALRTCEDDEKAIVKGVSYVVGHLSAHVGVTITGESFRVYQDGMFIEETDCYDKLDTILRDARYAEAKDRVLSCSYFG